MAGIIKAGEARQAGGGAKQPLFQWEDMCDKARSYLDQVQGQADKLLGQARQQAEQIRQQAAEQGRQDALQAARRSCQAETEQRLQTVLPALDQAITAIRDEKQAWLKRWEENAIRLATAIAARVVRREIRHTPDITLDLVREALELAAGSDQIRVHLHPQDYETLGNQVRQLAGHLAQLGQTEIVPDPEIGPGGCRVSTRLGIVDQQLDVQLARIEQELL